MAIEIDFSKVSIKISQFQEQSRGVFNAGEIRLTGETSLGIVNNHVGRLTQFMNNKHLTHSEVLAVKQAFVNALSREGKLDSNAINEVRRDLGLAPQENDSVADLHSRSIKPLSRQQVRQILDRYADTINDSLEATEGRIVVKSEELYGNVEENERATHESRRDEVNESLATRRTVKTNQDINIFEKLVAGNTRGLQDAERKRMLEMAQTCLEDVRERLETDGDPGLARGTLTLEFKGGKSITFATGLDDARLVARLEDDIFNLTYPVWSPNGDEGTIAMDDATYNNAVMKGLTTRSYMNDGTTLPLPHDFTAMGDALLEEARTLYGESVVPYGASIGDYTDSASLRTKIFALGNGERLRPDDVRELVRSSVKEVCAFKKIEDLLNKMCEALFLKTDIYPEAFVKRHPELLKALAEATTIEGVRALLDDKVEIFKEAVQTMAQVNRIEPQTKQMIAKRLAEKTGLYEEIVFALIRNAALPISGHEIAKDIVSGKIVATTPEEIKKAFLDRVAAYVDAKVAALEKVDDFHLGPRATHKLKARILEMEYMDPSHYDLDKFHAVAQRMKGNLDALTAAFNVPNPDRKTAYDAFTGFIGNLKNELTSVFDDDFPTEHLVPAARAIFAMCLPEDSDLPEKVTAFFARADLKNERADNGRDSMAKMDYVLYADQMRHDQNASNARLIDALGKGSLPPYHAQALTEALEEIGFMGVTPAIAAEAFKDRTALKSLIDKIKAANAYVLPQTFKNMVKNVAYELGAKFNSRLKGIFAAYMQSTGRKNDLAKFIEGDSPTAQHFRDVLDQKLSNVKTGLYDKIVSNVRTAAIAQFTRGVCEDMKKLADGSTPQIKKDFNRQRVKLNGVTASDTDFEQFRNGFAQLVTDDPSAQYGELDPNAKAKADLLMAFISQTTKNAILNSVNFEFSADGKNNLPFLAFKQPDWTIEISFSKNGDVVILTHGLNSEIKAVMGEDGTTMHSCKPGSEITYDINITLPAEEVNRLIALDYKPFNSAAFEAHVRDAQAVNPYQTALDQIPEPFRINAEVQVGFHAKLN